MTRIEWGNCIPDEAFLSKDGTRIGFIMLDPDPLDPRVEHAIVSPEDIQAYEEGEVFGIGVWGMPSPADWPHRADNDEYIKLTADNVGMFCKEYFPPPAGGIMVMAGQNAA